MDHQSKSITLDGISKTVELLLEDVGGPTRKELARSIVNLVLRVEDLHERVDALGEHRSKKKDEVKKGPHHGHLQIPTHRT